MKGPRDYATDFTDEVDFDIDNQTIASDISKQNNLKSNPKSNQHREPIHVKKVEHALLQRQKYNGGIIGGKNINIKF